MAIYSAIVGDSWLRHHTIGLMMMLAVLLAALLMWEGQR